MDEMPPSDGPNAGLLLLLMAVMIGIPIGILWREIAALVGHLLGW